MPDRKTIAVLASTPSGGHPEYVMKLLGGMEATVPQLEVVWPISPSVDPRYGIQNTHCAPSVMPAMVDRAAVGWVRWFLRRLNPYQRADVAFVRWLRTAGPFDAILLEELQRFTLPVVVLASRRRSAKVVFHLHNVLRHDYSGGFVDRCDIVLTGWALRRCASVLVHDSRSMHRAREVHNLKNCRLVPHGVEPQKDFAWEPDPEPTFLFFGVNRPEKGLEDFVSALKLLGPPYRGRVSGYTPPDREGLTRELLKLSTIEWNPGFVSPHEVPSHLHGVRAMVLPYRFFEAQSGVLHLAIEYGLPVIVSDVGALGDTVRQYGIGVVVPPGDVPALAKAMKDLAAATDCDYRNNATAAQSELSWPKVGATLSSILFGQD